MVNVDFMRGRGEGKPVPNDFNDWNQCIWVCFGRCHQIKRTQSCLSLCASAPPNVVEEHLLGELLAFQTLFKSRTWLENSEDPSGMNGGYLLYCGGSKGFKRHTLSSSFHLLIKFSNNISSYGWRNVSVEQFFPPLFLFLLFQIKKV